MRVLLTGATGCVGRHAYPALQAAGYDVCCATRRPEIAGVRFPERPWVSLDVSSEASCRSAFSECDAIVFLIHSMHAGSRYAEIEAQVATTVRQAAEAEGVRRLVYLGGVAPAGACSRHLASRLRTGQLLRSGKLDVVELRAAMIVAVGSLSWEIVHDLARRLPIMLLPKWLQHRSWPVDIVDVVYALLWALQPSTAAGVYDLPGAERLSHREVLERAAKQLGQKPKMVPVPVVSPALSSAWIGLVTRASPRMARELMQGLNCELQPQHPTPWTAAGGYKPNSFDDTVQRTLAEERAFPAFPTGTTLQAIVERGHRFA